MKVTDILRTIMAMKKMKPFDLASKLKIKPNTLSERMTQRNMSILKLSEMLRVLSYKILIVPQDTELPINGFEVTVGDESESDCNADSNVVSLINSSNLSIVDNQPKSTKRGRIALSKLSREELEAIAAEYTKEKLAELLSEFE